MYYNLQQMNDNEHKAVCMMDNEVQSIDVSDEEIKFLRLANDPVTRQHLLGRLEQLGLLSAFLAAESGTN